MVAGADADDAALQLFGRKFTHDGKRPAWFERSGVLEQLELELQRRSIGLERVDAMTGPLP